jgi:NAD-dependent SIR2 family protein deacetylase
VRVHGSLNRLVCTSCGFRLAGSRHDERRSRANARPTFTGRAKQKSSDLQVQLRITIREERDDGQHIGRIQDSDSGVPAGDEGTSEVDTVR